MSTVGRLVVTLRPQEFVLVGNEIKIGLPKDQGSRGVDRGRRKTVQTRIYIQAPKEMEIKRYMEAGHD